MEVAHAVFGKDASVSQKFQPKYRLIRFFYDQASFGDELCL